MDIKSTNETMGGIPVMLYGDFRQILPVIRSGTRANIINAWIKKLYLWKEVKHLKQICVHLHGDREACAFAETLINIVEGKSSNIVQQPYMVSVAELGNSATSVDDLIDKVFPNFQENVVDSDWLSEWVIRALNPPRLMKSTQCIVTKPLKRYPGAGPFKMRVM